MLFTAVDTEKRYKAKPVIDIVVYRGGDVATAWLCTALSATLSIGLAGIAVLAAGVAVVWAAAGMFLGRSYDRASGEN